MSDAQKCDRCGDLFETAKGCVTLETLLVAADSSGRCSSWSDVDFCPKCSKAVLEVVGPAIIMDAKPKLKRKAKP